MEVLISEPFYSILFIGVGLILLFLEVFVPSGGILGLLSVACVTFGIYGLFHQERTLLAVFAIGATAVIMLLGIRFGMRRLSFSGSLPPEVASSVDQRIDGLDGKEGVAHSPLRPAGIAVIEGRKVDVVTEGDFLEKGVRVRVTDTTGNRVVVRAVLPQPRAKRPRGMGASALDPGGTDSDGAVSDGAVSDGVLPAGVASDGVEAGDGSSETGDSGTRASGTGGFGRGGFGTGASETGASETGHRETNRNSGDRA